jgi:hypothetical protein
VESCVSYKVALHVAFRAILVVCTAEPLFFTHRVVSRLPNCVACVFVGRAASLEASFGFAHMIYIYIYMRKSTTTNNHHQAAAVAGSARILDLEEKLASLAESQKVF